MKLIALVPARCGSKGIKFKNIYPICNKPMISYAIKALQNSKIDEIYVSTDCDIIKNVSIDCGARVINRPLELASDRSPTIECVKHCISSLNLQNNDVIILVQPTSPMVKSIDIINGIDAFNLDYYDAIISVTINHNILWRYDNNQLIPMNHNLHERVRRQDMEKIYNENGAFYIFKVGNITQYHCLYGNGKVGYVEIPKSRAFQVDDYEDILIVESILRNKHE